MRSVARSGAARPRAAGEGPVLEVENLSTLYPVAGGLLHAVEDVSLTLESGGTLGVVGESGSGKSALVRSLMDLLPPGAVRAGGAVRFDGVDLRALPRRELASWWGRDIGIVFQDASTALTPTKRIGAQITEGLRRHLGLGRRQARSRAVELLELVGIPDAPRRLSAYPHQLSGGMRQRVCIAIAIACSPQLLLADEPTTALDVTIQRQILNLLDDLRRRTGMAMVLVSHDLGVVAGRTERIAVMYAGRLVELGATADVLAGPRHPYTAGLAASIPTLDDPPGMELGAIPGQPSRAIDPAPGCRFAPRCARALEVCTQQDPPSQVQGGRVFACFNPLDVGCGSEGPVGEGRQTGSEG